MRFCPTARNFYRIRRILIEMLGLPRHTIRPTSTLADLVPQKERRRVQQRFQRERMRFPTIRFSLFQKYIALFATLTPFLIGLVVFPFSGWALLVALAGGTIATTLQWPHAHEIDLAHTIRDAVRASTRMAHYIDAGYTPSRKEIADKVFDIVSANLGIKRNLLTEEMSWEDMGAE